MQNKIEQQKWRSIQFTSKYNERNLMKEKQRVFNKMISEKVDHDF